MFKYHHHLFHRLWQHMGRMTVKMLIMMMMRLLIVEESLAQIATYDVNYGGTLSDVVNAIAVDYTASSNIIVGGHFASTTLTIGSSSSNTLTNTGKGGKRERKCKSGEGRWIFAMAAALDQ